MVCCNLGIPVPRLPQIYSVAGYGVFPGCFPDSCLLSIVTYLFLGVFRGRLRPARWSWLVLGVWCLSSRLVHDEGPMNVDVLATFLQVHLPLHYSSST
jgi:hypothetical protein